MQQLHPANLGLIFIVLGLDRIFTSLERTRIEYSYFDTGFLMALGSLFFLPYILFLAIIWLAILLFRSINIRNFLNALVGFLAPWWLTYGLFFFLKGEISSLNLLIVEILPGHQVVSLSWHQVGIFSLLGIQIILASVGLPGSPGYKKVRIKRYFFLFFWIFIGMGISYLLLFGHQKALLVALALPVSYLFANYYSHVKKGKLAQILFTIFLMAMLSYPYLLRFYF